MKDRWEFRYITPQIIRDFFEEQNCIVFSCNRPSYKYQDASIGSAGAGIMIHVNVRHKDYAIPLTKTHWPPWVLVNTNGVRNHPLTYEIAEHPILSGVICLKNAPCHRFLRKQCESELNSRTGRKWPRHTRYCIHYNAGRGGAELC